MPIDFLGTAFGAAFGELLNYVKSVRASIADYSDHLEKLEATLIRLQPVVEEMEHVGEEFVLSIADTSPIKKMMRRAEDLIHQCSEIRSLDLVAKRKLSDQLEQLNREIWKEFTVFMPLVEYREHKRTQCQVSKVGEDMDLSVNEIKERIEQLRMSMASSSGSRTADPWWETADPNSMGPDELRYFAASLKAQQFLCYRKLIEFEAKKKRDEDGEVGEYELEMIQDDKLREAMTVKLRGEMFEAAEDLASEYDAQCAVITVPPRGGPVTIASPPGSEDAITQRFQSNLEDAEDAEDEGAMELRASGSDGSEDVEDEGTSS